MDFKKIIKEKGLKQNWIAEKIGVRPVELNYYLNKTRPMPKFVKDKLIEFLG